MSGFFGKILSGIGGLSGADAPAGTGNLLSELVSSAGGFSGIVAKFNQAGLGDKVQSWVGTGGNIPAVAGDILKVFPQDQLEALAQKHGVPAGMVGQLLAHVLPHAVDQATPNGTVADASDPGSTDAGQGWA